jgi:hypothetical protein
MFVYPPGFSLIASPAAHVALSGRADAAPNVVKSQAVRCLLCCGPASAAFSASVWMMGPGSLTGLPLIETGLMTFPHVSGICVVLNTLRDFRP